MNVLLTGIVAFSLLTACTPSEPEQEENNTAVSAPENIPQPESALHSTIYVKKDGRVYLNRVLTDLKGLEEALKQEKKKGFIIFYSRDDREQDPPETAIQVMDLIAKQELPIQFYTDSTFKEVVEFR